jgi:hypothetical protein
MIPTDLEQRIVLVERTIRRRMTDLEREDTRRGVYPRDFKLDEPHVAPHITQNEAAVLHDAMRATQMWRKAPQRQRDEEEVVMRKQTRVISRIIELSEKRAKANDQTRKVIAHLECGHKKRILAVRAVGFIECDECALVRA